MTDETRPVHKGGAGAALLAERRRQGLSLGDVSRQLKLSVRQIEAMEHDDFSWLGGPVFVHGFLRNYSKLLNLDPEPLIRDADSVMVIAPVALSRSATPFAKPVVKGKTRRMVLMVGTLLVIGGGVAFLGRSPDPAVPVATQEGIKSDPKPAETTPPASMAGTVADNEVATDRNNDASPVDPARPATDRAQGGGDSATAATRGATSGASTSGVTKLMVRMEFDEESWVEIKDRNGEIIFDRLNAAGSVRRAYGESPLTIVVGYAPGVRFFKGDKPVDLAPHTDVNVARFTLE